MNIVVAQPLDCVQLILMLPMLLLMSSSSSSSAVSVLSVHSFVLPSSVGDAAAAVDIAPIHDFVPIELILSNDWMMMVNDGHNH